MLALWCLCFYTFYFGICEEFLLGGDIESKSEILTLDCSHSTIAIGRQDYILFERETPFPLHEYTRVQIPLSTKRISALKVLSREHVFYCDEHTCNLCIIKSPIFYCHPLHRANVDAVLNITVAVASNSNITYVRAVEAATASLIARFKTQEKGDWDLNAVVADKRFAIHQQTVLGFVRHNFAYFVDSSYQLNEPLYYFNSKFSNTNVHRVKITRLCVNDETGELESRISMALDCENTNGEIESTSSANYDAETDQLLVTMRMKNGNVTVCLFLMEELNVRFASIWNTCQTTTMKDVQNDCKNAVSIKALKLHCWIITHSAPRTQPCARFGLDLDINPLNCELHKINSTSHRFGRLEDYRAFVGVSVAQLSNVYSSIDQIVHDNANRALFLSYVNATERHLIRVSTQEHVTKESQILWKSKTPAISRGMALGAKKDRLYVANGTKVSILRLTCSALYTTCESLDAGGWNDSLSCAWCTHTDQAVSLNEPWKCSQPLSFTCPPKIYKAVREGNTFQWEMSGIHLDLIMMGSKAIYVCDELCVVTPSISDRAKIYCTVRSIQDANCSVRIAKDGNPVLERNVSTEQTNDKNSTTPPDLKKDSNKRWKVVVGAILGIIIFLASLGLILLIINELINRKWKQNNGNEASVGFKASSYNLIATSNDDSEYLLHTPNVNYYQQLFEEIDSRIKIDVSNLVFIEEIGKGQFGVVWSATYSTPDCVSMKVACKTIQLGISGVREFIHEGLIMDRFDHPNVMRLIGIGFTVKKLPVIVTDYMPLGDLHALLRGKKNVLTVSDLLNFALQIAKGMEYLHFCRFIHRDLAARNCMMSSSREIKIADFGLCRECTTGNRYEAKNTNRMLPVRWMPLEALREEQFTLQGDVWAYGIVVWELFTRGEAPYSHLVYENKLPLRKLIQFLAAGTRLHRPTACPHFIFTEIMKACWRENPESRPTFTEIIENMENLIKELGNSQMEQTPSSQFNQTSTKEDALTEYRRKSTNF